MESNTTQPQSIWGIPKIRGTFLGVPILRIIVFWGLHWSPLILGKYRIIQKYLDLPNAQDNSLSMYLIFPSFWEKGYPYDYLGEPAKLLTPKPQAPNPECKNLQQEFLPDEARYRNAPQPALGKPSMCCLQSW